MRLWYTGKPCGPARKSHINFCVYDSTREETDAKALDSAPEVKAWVKNDHLGLEILYIYRGLVRKYRPDFLVRLQSGAMLVLEAKGIETEQDRTKFAALKQWTQAVNAHGGFGHWSCAMTRSSAKIHDILKEHAKEARA